MLILPLQVSLAPISFYGSGRKETTMDIFRDYKFNKDSGKTSVPCDRNNSSDKIARYDRFLDTSSEVSVEDTKFLKVDRVDRL